MVLTSATPPFDQLPEEYGVCGRYAPSPTGPLHLGNARTALIAWLQARLHGGRFIMRTEDLDLPRARKESYGQILDNLHWLGLDWDEGPRLGGAHGPYLQSQRHSLYQKALNLLIDRDLAFACYCSRKDIIAASGAPHRRGRTHLYPGTCRDNHRERPGTNPKTGRPPAWRLRAPNRDIALVDRIAGPFSQNLAEDVGDFVLQRTDGLFGYQLAVVVDDILMGMTDVVRGADLLDSTPRQVYLYELFGFPAPRFWHVPLLLDEEGKRMAKRDGSTSIMEARQNGMKPEELIGRLAATLNLVEPGAVISARDLLSELTPAIFSETLREAYRQAPPPF
ncbi:MAG: tRNA glutamyl-Q(34) synthetase GluQRS [Acidobacteriota bacterium]|nr:tRNA glutamyl-Q(34) synthetase GluQRS [Acidobacteriota bacterium]